MSVIRRVVGAALPVGSHRRSRVVRVARSVGLLGPGRASSYQRWIATVEPRLFSPVAFSEEARRAVSFSIEVSIETATLAEVERTFISLSDQTYPDWVARVVDSPDAPAMRACLARLRSAERRIVDDPASSPVAPFVVQIRAGDMLAPQALAECAGAAVGGVRLITSDHDELNQFGDQRTTPRRHVGRDIDALCQFDPFAGLVVRHRSLTTPTVDTSQHAGLGLVLSMTSDTHVHLGHILLHRRHRPGPIQRVLPATPTEEVSTSLGTRAIVQAGGPQMGTQVRFREFGVDPMTVAVIVTSPVLGDDAHRQRRHLCDQVVGANEMFASLGAPVTVVVSDRTLPQSPCAAAVVEELDRFQATVGFLIDGSLRVRSADAFVDLVALSLRTDVFAVAPIVVSPSNIAIDAGLGFADSLVARCGPLRRSPYDLLWTCAVDALSGRCLCASTAQLRRLDDRPVSATGLHGAVAAAGDHPIRLLIWPHHQVEFAFGLHTSGDAPAVLAWREHRLLTWFGDHIAPYSPLNDSDAESFW